VYQLNDNLTWVHGRHQAKFGVDYRITQQNAYRDIESRGFIDFTGRLLGNALEELLLGCRRIPASPRSITRSICAPTATTFSPTTPGACAPISR
jgi:hypothetical protein